MPSSDIKKLRSGPLSQLNITGGYGWFKANLSSVAGADGYDDTAIAAVSNTTDGDVFLSQAWNQSKFGEDKYVVYQADVKFGSNGDYFFVATNGHNPISPSVYKNNPKIKTNDWNTITVVSEADGGTTKVYINGIYDSSGKSYVTRDNYASVVNCIRFVTYAADKNDHTSNVVSYDNVLVYTTDVSPMLSEELLTGSYSADSGAVYTASCDYGVLVVAAYQGDVMLAAQCVELNKRQRKATLKTEGATKYVGYVWNGMTEMKPMCPSVGLNASLGQ